MLPAATVRCWLTKITTQTNSKQVLAIIEELTSIAILVPDLYQQLRPQDSAPPRYYIDESDLGLHVRNGVYMAVPFLASSSSSLYKSGFGGNAYCITWLFLDV